MLLTLKKVSSQAEQVLFSHQPSAGALQEIFHFLQQLIIKKKVLKKSRISYSKATKHLFLDFGLWNPFFEAKKVSNDWRCHGVTKFANPKKGKWVIFFKNIKDMTIWQEILCCLIISHLYNFFGILDVTYFFKKIKKLLTILKILRYLRKNRRIAGFFVNKIFFSSLKQSQCLIACIHSVNFCNKDRNKIIF